MHKTPEVDTNECNSCDGCLDISPETFSYNNDLNFIEVADLEEYNTVEVDEAIKNCPRKAISWN